MLCHILQHCIVYNKYKFSSCRMRWLYSTKPNICFQWNRRNLLAAVFTTVEGMCRLYCIPVKFSLVFFLFVFFFFFFFLLSLICLFVLALFYKYNIVVYVDCIAVGVPTTTDDDVEAVAFVAMVSFENWQKGVCLSAHLE